MRLILFLLVFCTLGAEEIAVAYSGEGSVGRANWAFQIKNHVQDVYPDVDAGQFHGDGKRIHKWSEDYFVGWTLNRVPGTPDRLIWVFYQGDADAEWEMSEEDYEDHLNTVFDNVETEADDEWPGVTVEFIIVKNERQNAKWDAIHDAMDTVAATRATICDLTDLEIVGNGPGSMGHYVWYIYSQDRQEAGERIADTICQVIAAGSG